MDLNPAALALGLAPGLSLADARAQVPELEAIEADPRGEARRLEALADFCRRHTPAVALDAPDGLYLDVTGCAHLFGGEAALTHDAVRRLARAGVQARFALADTPAGARALSHYACGTFAAEGETVEALAGLPPAAVLEPPDAAVLRRLGLRSLGQVLDLPRASLARRLGASALERLDEAVGLRSAPLLLRLDVPPHAAERRLAEPVVLEAQVLRITRELAERLETRLEGEGLGGRRFELELFRADGAVKRLGVDVGRPLRDPARIAALFAERLAALNEGLEADFGFDVLRLIARRVAPLTPRTAGLQDDGAGEAEAAVADRVAARYGAGRMTRPAPEPRTRLPEAAVIAAGVAEAAAVWADHPRALYDGAVLRPLRLFAPPEAMTVIAAEAPEGAPAQFRWRRVLRRVVKAEGPERLASEWWRDGEGAPTRDYYRLEDSEGRRYWAFRQGLYSEVEQPRWFVHGLFP